MAEDWEVKLIRSPAFKGMAPDRQKVVYQEARKRYSGQQVSTQPQAPAQPETREQYVGRKMQETENSPLGAFTSGGRSVMTLGLSDLLGKQFGLKTPESPYRTAGQAATVLGGLAPTVAKTGMAVAKGIPYTRIMKGGQRFAGELAKSPATVDLTQEAETLARARHGVNPALKKATISRAEQTYQNMTGKTPVEDLLNARGQVGVSTAHDVGNLTSQNLAKSYFDRLGEALRGGNELGQLGLKPGINRKIVAADPALKEVFKNYGMGQKINKVASALNPLEHPLAHGGVASGLYYLLRKMKGT